MKDNVLLAIRPGCSVVLILWLVANVQTQAQDQITAAKAAEYDFSIPIGPHHRRVDATVTVRDENGNPVEKPTHYVELATGMNYLEKGEWKPSEETIEPHERGAAALKGYYKVIFGKNLNRAGVIELTLPDGQKQKNHPLGLYYYDRADGKWVKLSGIKDSEGVIIPPNRVLYSDAFDSIRGDILYTYEKGRFEADVILRERPAAPDTFGLNNETTMVEMASEFPETPEPKKTKQLLKKEEDQTKRATMAQPDVTDEWLDFGETQMVPGAAFAFELGQKPTDPTKQIPVGKRWWKDGSRNILSEQVEHAALVPMLAQLPISQTKGQLVQRGVRLWPDSPAAAVDSTPMAEGVLDKTQGVTLDYTVSGTVSDFVFTNGVTFYLTGQFYVQHNCTFQSGTHLKYASGAYLQAGDTVSGSGATMTAKDDNTAGFGDIISGSTGSPSAYYALQALLFYYSNSSSLSGFTIKYANYAVWATTASATSHTVTSFLIQDSSTGFILTGSGGGTLTATSPTFCGVATQYSGSVTHTGDTTCSNTSPTISNMTDSTIARNSSLGVNFTIGDSQTPDALIVTASSSNTSLVPNSNLSITGSSATARYLSVTPLSNTSGQTTITVTVNDGLLTASDTFVLTVNDPPVVSQVLDRTTPLSTTSAELVVTVSDVETSAASLTMSGSASPSGLVQTFDFGGSGSTRTVKITPVTGQPGTALITITVTDGGGATGSRNFNLTITADDNNPDGYQYAIVDLGAGSGSSGPGSSSTGSGASGGGGAGGGGGEYYGPAGPVNLTAIKNLLLEVPETCHDYPGGDPQPQDSHSQPSLTFGTKDESCPVDVQYKVRFSIAGQIPDGPASGGGFARALVSAGGNSVAIDSPNNVRNSCSMMPASKTDEIIVKHGDVVFLYYQWIGYFGVNSGMTGRPYVQVTDVEIVSVSVDGGRDWQCPACVGSFGTDDGRPGSASTGFRAGRTGYGRWPVDLRLYQQDATPMLTSAQSLYLLAGSIGDLDVVTDTAKAIRQIKGPLGLVDVVKTNDYNYCISFYSSSAITNGGVKVNGLYVLANGATPLRCYQVLNPSGSTNNPNCVQFIENRSGVLLTNQFDYTSGSATWQYWRANRTRLEKRQYSTNSGVRTETHTIHDPVSTNTVIRKRLEKLQSFAWGSSMIEHTRDPDGVQLKTSYNYFTNTTDNGYGKLQQAVYENGGWQTVEYDAQHRISRIYSSYLNQGPTNNASLCRKIDYDYTPLSSSGDNGAYRPNLPRREIEYVLGQEVSRKYYVYKDRGRDQELNLAPPSEPYRRVARIRLSG